MIRDVFIQDTVASLIRGNRNDPLPLIRKGVVVSVDLVNRLVDVQLHGSTDTTTAIPYTAGLSPVAGNDCWLFAIGDTLVAWSHNPYTWQDIAIFTNSWANQGSPYFNAGYRVTADGQVWLRGVIINGTANTSAFTLPVGARPQSRCVFAVLGATTPTVGRLHIEPTGTVIPVSGGNTFVTLDNARFDIY